MLVFASLISILCAALILLPFFVGPGGSLQAAASINSIERLEGIKSRLLQRYLDDEKAFQEKRLQKLAWDQRKAYLTNRYIDSARRLDYLKNLLEEQKAKGT